MHIQVLKSGRIRPYDLKGYNIKYEKKDFNCYDAHRFCAHFIKWLCV